jgi:hypothetical protein
VIGVVDRTSLDAEFNKLSSDFRAILLAMANRFEKMVNRVVEFSSRTGMRIQKTLSLKKQPQRSRREWASSSLR